MAFSEPGKILDIFGLQSGLVVADLGCGTGFYTIEAAKRIEGGHIYAVDIQEELLERLKNSLAKEHISSVSVVQGDLDEEGGTNLKDAIADAALICNVLFQIEKKDDFVKEVKRILKSTGRVLVVDWAKSFNGLGPKKDAVMTPASVKDLFNKQGFKEVRQFDAGDHHYGIIFKNNE